MQKTDKYASVQEEITTVFHENKGRYGYQRITTVLRSRGFLVNHKTVQRKALSVPDSRSAQQRSGQLHDFRPSCA
ncbi:IS3 family transposase [Butyricicoccus sp. BIOML-A1]|nr:IS3 family transposase [Butyricicoccus sp. BIOML-A1]